jgi:hypothetical protein
MKRSHRESGDEEEKETKQPTTEGVQDLRQAVWTLAEELHHPEQMQTLRSELLDVLVDNETTSEEQESMLHTLAFCLTDSFLPDVYADFCVDLLAKNHAASTDRFLPILKGHVEARLREPESCLRGLQAWALLAQRHIASPNGLPEYTARLLELAGDDTQKKRLLASALASTPLPHAMDFESLLTSQETSGSCFDHDAQTPLVDIWRQRPEIGAEPDRGFVLDTSILLLNALPTPSPPHNTTMPYAVHELQEPIYEQFRMYQRMLQIVERFGRRNHRRCCEYLHLVAAWHLRNDDLLSVRAVQNLLLSLLLNAQPSAPSWPLGSSPSPPTFSSSDSTMILAACLLVGGCRHTKAFAPALAQATFSLVDAWLPRCSDYGSIVRLAHWFSWHLSHYEHKWPWGQWDPAKPKTTSAIGEDAETLPANHHPPIWTESIQVRVFFLEFVQYCLRLSYSDHLKGALPAYLHGLIPPVPKPTIDVSSEDPLLQSIRAKQPIDLASILRTSDTDDGDDGGKEDNKEDEERQRGVEHFVKCLLIAGSKTISHGASVLERHLGVLQALRQAGHLQPDTLLSVTFAFWRLHGQNFELAVDRYLRYEQLLTPAQLVVWYIKTLPESWSSMTTEDLVRRLLRPGFSHLALANNDDNRRILHDALQSSILDVEVHQLMQLFLSSH